MLADAAERATRMIMEHREALDRLIQLLMDKESVEQKELVELLGPAVTDPEAAPSLTIHAGPAT